MLCSNLLLLSAATKLLRIYGPNDCLVEFVAHNLLTIDACGQLHYTCLAAGTWNNFEYVRLKFCKCVEQICGCVEHFVTPHPTDACSIFSTFYEWTQFGRKYSCTNVQEFGQQSPRYHELVV